MGEIFTANAEGKRQADGAQAITLGVADRFREHQVQLVPSAAPAAGTLTVAVKTPGASGFCDVETIDMTDASKYMLRLSLFAAEMRFTPDSFDGDKTYSVFVCSGAGV